jgi:hypothetical protein
MRWSLQIENAQSAREVNGVSRCDSRSLPDSGGLEKSLAHGRHGIWISN